MKIYYKKMDEYEFKKLKRSRKSAKRKLEKIEEKINKEEHIRATMITIEATKKSEIARIKEILYESDKKNTFLDMEHEEYEDKLKEVLREYLEFLEESYL